MNWPAALAIVVLVTASQEWFYEHHRRRYGMWRSTRERRFWADPDERRLMWAALTHRDPDPTVERARLVCWAGFACAVVGAILSLNTAPVG